MRCKINLSEYLFKALCLIGFVIIIYLFQIQESVVTLNSKAIVDGFVTSHIETNNIDNKKIDTFGSCLDSTVNTFANKHHFIVVPKQAVIAGAHDITPEIMSLVEANCV